ncbi:VOC family protein [Olivibacter sp. SDN3]|uniref:VOC family protein n=1 Tax=Olivibacter sp. SDN3 TaxID=2764720 RepID=UPI001651854F|nr:VOC family protein [Olivibacter sp. SDN3]QNL48407.1 VOC family protein [Olivibacter sp. SDN3]
MKKLSFSIVCIMLCSMANTFAQTDLITEKMKKMKLNAGIITDKLQETKDFYRSILNFGITFENDFYLLMHTPDQTSEISFLLPDHPSQQVLFQSKFEGRGVYFTIEVDNINEIYQEIKRKEVTIEIDLREEPWGDKHFAIRDPNGVGVDIVEYHPSSH